MNRKIHFGGIFAASILLALMLLGFRPEPLAEAARNGPGDIPVATKQHLVETYGKLPLSFEANLGQTSSQVKFLSRAQGYTLFLTRHAEAVLVLGKSAPKRTPAQPADKLAAFVEPQREAVPPAVLRMKLVGAKLTPQVEGVEEFPGKANYIIGNDPKKWRTNVPTYAKVRYHEVYPGVDLVYYGKQRQLEHDFIVAPGADPSSITLGFAGAEKMSLDPRRGALVLSVKGGEVRFEKPRIYQELGGTWREISGGYVLKNANGVGFAVAAYDANKPLVIDPTLFYSTYLGGSGEDLGLGIAADGVGNAYVTGETGSTDFPGASSSMIQSSNGGGFDAFVAKINAAGTALVYSTYLGGSSDDLGFGIAVDAAGNAYVTGETGSTDFHGASSSMIQSSNGGGFDAFVAKINAGGTALVYSTYLGGSSDDLGFGIAADGAGNAYVTGYTLSTDFPGASSSMIQSSNGGGFDAFVAKFNAGGTALVYSTYLGGSGDDAGQGIAVDAAGHAYVTGYTFSTNFPTTLLAFQSSNAGSADAFVTKLNPTGSAPLVYSTYLGGTDPDVGQGIAVDATGNAYVTGNTVSTDFPTTLLAFQSANAGSTDAFVTKLNPAGSVPLVYSTYLGGSGDDFGQGIAVDAAGNAYVTGYTGSTNFPTTAGAFQIANAGSNDAFVTTLNPAGSAPLVFSTYLGGSSDDFGFGIAVDAAGNAYVTGQTLSTNFTTTPGVFQSTNAGNSDAFVTKIAGFSTCKPEKDDVEGHGHERGDDGREGEFHFCKSSGDMDFDERDRDGKIGRRMKGKMRTVTVLGDQAIISGSGTLADGTPVNYTAVFLGNQPVVGTNHFAISWIAANGSVFQTSGPLTDGSIVVQPQ